jgi:hypothetical protein
MSTKVLSAEALALLKRHVDYATSVSMSRTERPTETWPGRG